MKGAKLTKNKESKTRSRKNCLYYGMTLCPYRMVCEYSVLSAWTERHYKEKGDTKQLEKHVVPVKCPLIDDEDVECNFTDAEISKSFIEDVETVKDLLPQESEDEKC